jgi:hypothetical protein
LKPENVLLDKDLNVFLCDFGLAKQLADKTQVNMTQNVGTAAYMAPEIIRPDAMIKPPQFNSDDEEEDAIIQKLPDSIMKRKLRAKQLQKSQDMRFWSFNFDGPGHWRFGERGILRWHTAVHATRSSVPSTLPLSPQDIAFASAAMY